MNILNRFRASLVVAGALAATMLLPNETSAQEKPMTPVKNVLLVHGAWADGSSWSKVIPQLEAKGLNVTAVQLSLTSLADDAATVRRALALEDGPVLLVGHSYGGAVITEAGNDPKVVGLVYVAAFAPDAGQSPRDLSSSVPAAPMGAEIRPDANGFLKLTRKGIVEDFAQDLTDVEQRVLFAAQAPTSVKCLGSPITTPAWKNKPSWYILASNDRTIPPSLQDAMSTKIHATVVRVASSHVAMLALPEKVVDVIFRASSRTASN